MTSLFTWGVLPACRSRWNPETYRRSGSANRWNAVCLEQRKSAVAAARVERGVQVLGKSQWYRGLPRSGQKPRRSAGALHRDPQQGMPLHSFVPLWFIDSASQDHSAGSRWLV